MRLSNGRPVLLLQIAVAVCLLAAAMQAQDSDAPVIVQPGAPGQPTKVLPADTKAVLPPVSRSDVEFMQGMIMHHQQAVDMVALMPSRSTNKDLLLLGARIGHSQADEIRFMERWLGVRGESTSMPKMYMSGMHMNMPGMEMPMLMPGMLTAKQMAALKRAKGKEFDRLFLTGMIQHHGGALTMVKDLVGNAGAAQNAEIFNFITDIDTGQRAEIRIMQGMLDKIK